MSLGDPTESHLPRMTVLQCSIVRKFEGLHDSFHSEGRRKGPQENQILALTEWAWSESRIRVSEEDAD